MGGSQGAKAQSASTQPLRTAARLVAVTVGGSQLLSVPVALGALWLMTNAPEVLITGDVLPQDGLVQGVFFAYGLLAMAVFALTLAAIPCWMTWHWRAARNLMVLNRHTDHHPRWHVAYWFVPLVNLWMPYVALGQIYERSNPDGATAPSAFTLWWVLHVLGNVLNGMAFRMSMRGDAMELAELSTLASVVAAPISLGAAWLYVRWITRISAWQDAEG